MTRRLAALLALALTACHPSPQHPAGPTPIRFATDWRAEGEQGGFYEAQAEGLYARRGLAVQILEGGPGSNVPQLVATGAADLGVGSNSFIVMNLAKENVPVKAVAAFMQKDPQVLIAHPGAGIAKIADMKGRPILLSDASITAFWVWLKAKYGFTDAQVRKYSFNNGPFLADRRAVQQGYLTSEPYTIEKQAHEKPLVFLLADEGYPGYADMVLASDKMIAARPQAIAAFVAASRQGWRDYLHGDPAPADRLILKDNPEMTEDVLAQARAQMVAHGVVESGDAAAAGPGAMSEARWASFFQAAAGQGVYPKDMDWRRAYTLAFVGKP